LKPDLFCRRRRRINRRCETMPILILAPQDSLGEISTPVPLYKFHGAQGIVNWPRDAHAHLGPVGAWNIFFRLGYLPAWVTLAELSTLDPVDNLLVISSLGQWARAQEEKVEQWLHKGGRVLAAGISPHWPAWLGFPPAQMNFTRLDHPNGAFGANLDATKEIRLWSSGEQLYLEGPQEIPAASPDAYGQLFMVHGEIQTPARAAKTPLKAPALWTRENLTYVNGNIFAGFQAWLQGQSDLAPWLNWRHRLFWLDEWVCDLNRLLETFQLLPARPTGEPDLPKITVIFRHDVDSSRDTGYLELEEQNKLPATYAVLRDDNTTFWLSKLAGRPALECAFHYNTIKKEDIVQRLCTRFTGKRYAYRPAKKEIVGKGLWEQVQLAKKDKIGITTLHRHGPFLLYPEWIDALDYVLQKEPEVLGAASLFRSNLLKWGTDRVDGVTGTFVHFPDTQFPLWLPFKLAHAGYQGRPLRGWESTHIMEPEPELFAQILEHALELPLPYFVFPVGFHPAHAHRPTFTADGCLSWFKQILAAVNDLGGDFQSLSRMYQKLDKVTHNSRYAHGSADPGK
jgi:hypothetical protein